MAIKFEDDMGDAKPAKKEVGGKTYVAKEPAPSSTSDEMPLPFAKPIRPDKKGRRK